LRKNIRSDRIKEEDRGIRGETERRDKTKKEEKIKKCSIQNSWQNIFNDK